MCPRVTSNQHTYQCVCESPPPVVCGWHLTANQGRSAQSLKGLWSHQQSVMAVMHGTSLLHVCLTHSRKYYTRTLALCMSRAVNLWIHNKTIMPQNIYSKCQPIKVTYQQQCHYLFEAGVSVSSSPMWIKQTHLLVWSFRSREVVYWLCCRSSKIDLVSISRKRGNERTHSDWTGRTSVSSPLFLRLWIMSCKNLVPPNRGVAWYGVFCLIVLGCQRCPCSETRSFW